MVREIGLRDTEGGHCQGACRPHRFFLTSHWNSVRRHGHLRGHASHEGYSLYCWSARNKSPQACPQRDSNPGLWRDRRARYQCAINLAASEELYTISYVWEFWSCTAKFQTVILYLSVAQPKVFDCSAVNFTRVLSGGGYLSNTVTMETRCGTIDSPWLLQALPGQHVNITLLEFTPMAIDSDRGCLQHALVEEVGSGKKSLICGSTTGNAEVYVSAGNAIKVSILNARSNSHPFLLKYQGRYIIGQLFDYKETKTTLRR